MSIEGEELSAEKELVIAEDGEIEMTAQKMQDAEFHRFKILFETDTLRDFVPEEKREELEEWLASDSY